MKDEALFEGRKDQIGSEKTGEGRAVGVEEWQPSDNRYRCENLTRKPIIRMPREAKVVIYISYKTKVLLS